MRWSFWEGLLCTCFKQSNSPLFLPFFYREAERFDQYMERISNHVNDVITKYNGTFGLVAWLSADDKVKICSSMNLGTGVDFIPPLLQAFRAHAPRLQTKSNFMLMPEIVGPIWGQGHSDSARKDSQGFWNKKAAISRIFDGIHGKYSLAAVIVLQGSVKSYHSSYPRNNTGLMAVAKSLQRHFSTSANVRVNPSLPCDPALKRLAQDYANSEFPVKKRRRSTQSGRRRGKNAGEDIIHDTGTYAWYCNQLKSSKNTPPHALFRTETSMHFALLDARASGSKMTVHHQMLVEVELHLEQMRAECSCDVFRHCGADQKCVHAMYVENTGHQERLKSMHFPERGAVVQILRNNGEPCAYYADGCFVRRQARRGFRCDTDLEYGCRHVQRVCESLGIDQRLAEELDEGTPPSDDEDEDSDDEENGFARGKWIVSDLQRLKIPYPYTRDVAHAAAMVSLHGFGSDLDASPRMWFGDTLKPQIPAEPCNCGHMYTSSNYVNDTECVVYLRHPTIARKLPCMRLECPGRNKGCDRHYIGVHDGLLRIGPAQVVELDMLMECALDLPSLGGVSLTAQWEKLKDKFDSFKALGMTSEQFIEVNAFRSAIYKVARCVEISFTRMEEAPNRGLDTRNFMLCPICKDAPEVIIMDGTSTTIRADACKHASMTHSMSYIRKKRPHTMLNRCFVNAQGQDRTKAKRSKFIKLLHSFVEWLSPRQVNRTSFQGKGDLLRASDPWNIGPFIRWAHDTSMNNISDTKRNAIKQIFREVASPSPTTAYFTYRAAEKLQSLVSQGLRTIAVREFHAFGPVMAELLKAVCPPGALEVCLPTSWDPFIAELIQRSLDIHKVDYETGEYGLGPRIQHPRDPSILNDDFLHSGMCCGLRKLRHRPTYDCDFIANKEEEDMLSSDKAPCKHAFHKPGKRTGGVFTCLCEHGFTYASFIIKKAEGRNEPFTFLTCFFENAPRIVIYDFACSLMDYCLNRAPNFFKDTLFLVDKFHWYNHVACAKSFDIRIYRCYNEVKSRTRNSQACEQINAAMKRLRFVLSRMGQEPFMLFIRLFVARWNRKKLEKILEHRERAERALNYAGHVAQGEQLVIM